MLKATVITTISIIFLSICFGQQSETSENNLMCGPNCLWLAARAYSTSSTLEELMYLAGTSANGGTNLNGMIKALNTIGLHPLVIKTNWAGLFQIKVPTILLLKGRTVGHYVYFDEISQESVRIIDPPERKTWTRGQFMKRFTGYAIVVCRDYSEEREFQQQLVRSKISLKTNGLFFFSVLASTVVIAFWILRYHGRTEKTS